VNAIWGEAPLRRAAESESLEVAAYASHGTANGFVVESPELIAFCANLYNGIEYPTPTLFTVRSLDGKPIADSERVRIYHGFGDPRLRVAGKDLTVLREDVVRFR